MTPIVIVCALAVCGGCGRLRRWWLYISFNGVKQPWVRFRESSLEEHESEAVHIVATLVFRFHAHRLPSPVRPPPSQKTSSTFRVGAEDAMVVDLDCPRP